jgi:hypothetical protein
VIVQIKVGLVDTPVAPLDGDGLKGIPGAVHGAEVVVKPHTGPVVDPELFFATIFQR